MARGVVTFNLLPLTPRSDGRFRNAAEQDDAGQNEGDAENGRGVEGLAEQKNANEGDEEDAHARPNGVRHRHGDGFQREREKVERDGVADNDDQGGNEAGESLGSLQGGDCGGHFRDDGDEQEKPFHNGQG